MSSNAKPDTSRSRTRTRTGCWTCRARKKKCDEARPHCQTCRNLGLACEGYGVRLKWARAARGKPRMIFDHKSRARSARSESLGSQIGSSVTGTPEPVLSSDGKAAQDAVLLEHLGQDIFDSLSELERRVLYDHADWGFDTLVTIPTRPEPGRFRETLSYCAKSPPLLLNSLTYQMTLDPRYLQHVDEYYGRSVAHMRKTLMDTTTALQDDLAPLAGILLCSISMHRAMPWTIHLNGIAGILIEQGILDTPSDEWSELARLIGVLDLPTHTLGRRGQHLHMWYRYSRHEHGIDDTSGLPCTLIHLLASALESDVEDRLLRWSMEPGEHMMCMLWDATRYAGVIMVREFRKNQGLSVDLDTQVVVMSVHQTLSILRQLRTYMNQDALLISDGLLFPLVAAGSQTEFLTPDDRTFIREGITMLSNRFAVHMPHAYYKAVILALETYWANSGQKSLDQVTRDLDLELGLF